MTEQNNNAKEPSNEAAAAEAAALRAAGVNIREKVIDPNVIKNALGFLEKTPTVGTREASDLVQTARALASYIQG